MRQPRQGVPELSETPVQAPELDGVRAKDIQGPPNYRPPDTELQKGESRARH